MANGEMLQGPADTAQCPRIVLKGSAYQRGYQYGKQFEKYLPAFYDWFVKKPFAAILTAEYRSILEELEKNVFRRYPLFLDEIKGRADGSGMHYDSCRVLAFHNDIRSLLKPGCSNALATGGPDGPWLARTCDLREAERQWQVLSVHLADDGLSYACTGYLGLMGGVGVNSAGLAVGGSSSSSAVPPSTTGLSNVTTIMLAAMRNVDDCCRLAREDGLTGKGANIALLDASGAAAVVEYAPGIVAVLRPDSTGFLACTNHSVTGKIPPSDAVRAGLENSKERYDHLCAMVGEAAPDWRTLALAKRALADHGGEHHVCQHIAGGYNTIYCWVIQPGFERSVMHFNWGYPCLDRYETITLDWKNSPF